MRRHGWAVCLGIFWGGTALAQPPAEAERFPLAPDLPGAVVSKVAASPTSGGRPVVTATHLPMAVVALKPSDTVPPTTPLGLPVQAAHPVPYTNIVTTSVVPLAVGTPTPSAPCPTVGPRCASGAGGSKLIEWLTFQSKSKQEGCVPTPYRPSLQAWFPCDPRAGACVAATAGGCATNAAKPAIVAGSYGAKTAAPVAIVPVETDPLQDFRRITGEVSFTPGTAPMAAPTRPVSRVK